jgi:Kef-type K+ transport system membrane component KefB
MEMVTGVLLGPSLLGVISPEAQSWLFPKVMTQVVDGHAVTFPHPNMSILYALAQIGLVLYMFVIGLELDLGLLRGRIKSAGLVSSSGIIVPFVLGALLLPVLLQRGDLYSQDVSAGLAWLFIGASISNTAFPMLARMLYESGIANTRLGALTLAAGSIDDAVAWCLLALVLALFKNTPHTFMLTVGLGLVYAFVLLTLGRRVMARFAVEVERTGEMSVSLFTSIIVALMICAWFTDLIGIYAVFGAFVLGAAMPKATFATLLTERTEQVTTALFLPMFFVYSGLNTKLDLVNTPELWGLTAIIVLVSTLGKGVACMLAARLGGEHWRQSALIGTLMNSRGLMELILLNIGLERGVVTQTFFTIMVIMAVVTTGMASPLYRVISRGLALEGARVPGTRRPLAMPDTEVSGA